MSPRSIFHDLLFLNSLDSNKTQPIFSSLPIFDPTHTFAGKLNDVYATNYTVCSMAFFFARVSVFFSKSFFSRRTSFSRNYNFRSCSIIAHWNFSWTRFVHRKHKKPIAFRVVHFVAQSQICPEFVTCRKLASVRKVAFKVVGIIFVSDICRLLLKIRTIRLSNGSRLNGEWFSRGKIKKRAYKSQSKRLAESVGV